MIFYRKKNLLTNNLNIKLQISGKKNVITSPSQRHVAAIHFRVLFNLKTSGSYI